ncbi:TSUP family transporter [Enterobacter bugandensis]|uniref:Probable membrane transporter protein n=1 Tax=Enterobacter bugandensis TaxID=881260 RepID=A0AA42PY90_9ENTR|nr:TSUP family transporter [Enterobacter bugandensis]MDH1321590.1 TSUP family transporter [Enterobacter bugandensis]
MTDVMHVATNVVVILFFVSIFAGFIDAVAGGGGLISTPAMLILGLPPVIALGTNRLQSSIGELTPILIYKNNGKINTEYLTKGIISVSLGAVLGSYFVSSIPNDALYILLPILMVVILIYTIFSKKIRDNKESRSVVSMPVFMTGMGLLLGFYNGFFGPGTGSLWVISFISLVGYTIKNASINAKPLNFSSNIISLMCFIYMGQVNFVVGIVMALGQIIGSSLGSHTVLKNGDKIVRPVFILVTSIMTLKMIYDGVTLGKI